MSDSQQRRPLGQQMLRGIGIFQVIVAFPAMCILGYFALDQLFWPQLRYYYFFMDLMTAFIAAGIVFIVYVQRKAIVTTYQTLLFETSKTLFATALWLWLILDSAFGPWQNDWDEHRWNPGREEMVAWRVRSAALAIIVLVILFYPSLGYTYMVWKSEYERVEGGDDGGRGEERTERTPLLAEENVIV
ncbi:hypothetical protein CC80DRAFT_546844 [Byssothecium circinans]|uniref:MARVEL domain-containing protein n=1 Tax=Byssothecium circinans TaxID=147558 RepID=A0A6A5U1R5_9PLEO|nr:hypothetical protein CC80DRAFT_546844 [Byssothecium circinans]